jgi:hypothetical protein
MLLPPAYRLAGPLVSQGSALSGSFQAGAALGGMASQAGRALGQARQLAGRAGAAAAARRPELERLAQQAASDGAARMDRLAKSAAARAGRNAQAARDAFAGAPPPTAILQRHRGAILYGVGVLGIAVLAGAAILYNVLSDRATRAAAIRVNTASATYSFGPLLHYDSISASPFGVTTLNHVTAGPFDGIAISAHSLTISNVVWHGATLAGFHAALDGISLPLLQIARQSPSGPLRNAIGLGYTAPQASLALDATFDDASSSLTVTASGSVHGLGDASFTATVGGLTPRAIQAVLQAGPGAATSALAHVLTLVQARLTVNDAPLVTRMHLITSSDIPGADSRTGDVPPGISATLTDAMSRDKADAAAQIIATWLRKGGSLTWAMHPAEPVSLLGRNFLSRSGLEIGN